MSKTNRIYKLFMATMIVAIAGMLLAMGIIAAQKTMKLGVQFSSNPNYKLVIAINNADNIVFKNFDTVIMDKGISNLKGDTLIADDDVFKDYGNDFTIIIKNYTESTGIQVAMESTAKIDGGADGIPAQIQAIDNTASKYDPNTQIADSVSFRIYINSVFPQTTTLKMTISELASYNVSFNVGNSASGNISETVDYGTNYSQLLTAKSGYVFNGIITVNGIQSGGYSWVPNGETATFSIIDWSKVTGPISIVVTAIQNTFTIIFDANGGSFANSETTYSVPVTAGSNYTLPTPPTRTEHNFLGWADESSDTSPDWKTGSQPCNSDKTWYAVWERVIYNVTVNIDIFFTDSSIRVAESVWEFEININEAVPISMTKTYNRGGNHESYLITQCFGVPQNDIGVVFKSSNAGRTQQITLTFNTLANITGDIEISLQQNLGLGGA